MAQRMWYDVQEIAEIVRKHQLWLKNHRKFRGYRADFRGVDLYDVIFSGNVHHILNLQYADFSGCDCSRTVFEYTDLCNANFTGTNLVGAKVNNVYFTMCNTYNRNFTELPLLRNGLRVKDHTIIGPVQSEGELIVYKFVVLPNDRSIHCIAKLKIPADAKRIIFDGMKCRAERAIVLDIYDNNGNHYDCAKSYFFNKFPFYYRIGEEVVADIFDDRAAVECAGGIHFFLTEAEAFEFSYIWL